MEEPKNQYDSDIKDIDSAATETYTATALYDYDPGIYKNLKFSRRKWNWISSRRNYNRFDEKVRWVVGWNK